MVDRAGVVPQLLGAAVGIVLGSVLLFVVLGMLRDDSPPSPQVVADPTPTATAADDGATPSEDDAAAPVGDESPSAEPPGDATPEPEPTEQEPTEQAPTEQVDPAEVSIQVLDAVGGGGGSNAAQAVADELRDAGYNVVVVNQAGRNYDVTTVFWSPGQAAAGQQVAAEIGAGQAEETPDEVRLSDSVDVHVVVGADKA